MNSPQTASLINDANPVGTPCKNWLVTLGARVTSFRSALLGTPADGLFQSETFKHGSDPPATSPTSSGAIA